MSADPGRLWPRYLGSPEFVSRHFEPDAEFPDGEVEVFMHRDKEGVLVVTIDTSLAARLEKVRVNVNDGSVYSSAEIVDQIGEDAVAALSPLIDVS